MRHRNLAITSEIHQVGGGGLTAADDAAVYLINFAGHAALVDAGCGRAQERLLDNIRATGVEPEQIEYLLLTHCHFDHTGGAKALKDRLGCLVVAHALDAEFLEKGDDTVTAANWYGARLEPCPVDRKLTASREAISLGDRVVTAIHTPGHSPGSVVYLTQSQDQTIVLAQDVHGPLHPSLLSNAADYQASLRQLLRLNADVLCEGHYGVYHGRDSVDKFIRSFVV